MNLIGYWTEDLRDENLPLPQELVGEMSKSVRDAVCAYLRSGRVFEIYGGLSWCRFRCAVEDREMGSQEFTDGEWAWPEGLVHYVSAHGILLPAEFIARATSGRMVDQPDRGRKAPPDSWFQPDQRRNVSLNFWIAWSRQRQSPTLRQRLRDALAAARAAEPALVERAIETGIKEVLTREKEGSAPCIFAGVPGVH